MNELNKITLTEDDRSHHATDTGKNPQDLWGRLKKPLIYFLLAAVGAGCFYLIGRPKANSAIVTDAGFNVAVPQAKDDQLQSDKQKAYEQQLLEQKNEEKRNAVTSLSDYWNEQDITDSNSGGSSAAGPSSLPQSDQNAVNSYRQAQQTLSSFYSRDDEEISHLRKEISRLKNETVQNNGAPAVLGVNDQLALMEKSYQMAAKYLPTTTKREEPPATEDAKATGEKTQRASVSRAQNNVVSSLYREQSDSAFGEGLHHNRFYGLRNAAKYDERTTNAIRAVVSETKMLVSESTVSIRLSEAMQLGDIEIPSGTLLIAAGKFQGGRLQLKISSIHYKGNVYPAEINIHDIDGQLGLYVPYSAEQNAITDIVANMSQASGTNIMMTQSAEQQVAADLSRGIVQGVSGYFQKRVKQQKVKVKAGHQVLLVPKNK